MDREELRGRQVIRHDQTREPDDFHELVRKPGEAWLAENPARRPKDYWSRVIPALAAAFGNLCAYSAMETFPGTVDHYRSCKNARHLAYEWSNYRYCLDRINSCKGTADEMILDPFEVDADWFEILIPTMQLVLTDAVPPERRERAEFTLKRLQLIGGKEDDWIVRFRRSWFDMYESGDLSLARLEQKAPLIARAIRKRDAAQHDARPDE
jgi:hypothetical protein